MAHLYSTELSGFYNKNIELFSNIKFGQFNKYLNLTPIFVTYYSVNLIHSRQDLGTGDIQEEIGPDSPLRYDRINDLPIYNLPDLKPAMDYDPEKGIDLELDLNDVVLLPNTIRPRAMDYIVLKIPGAREMVFRVNDYGYNTIQSNDYYTISLDIKYIGENLNEKFTSQVMDTYECVFEHIGTNDKCIIKTDDFIKSKRMLDYIEDTRTRYIQDYFFPKVNSFAYYNPHDMWQPYITDPRFKNLETSGKYLYDLYLSKFIMDSEVLFKEFTENNIVITYEDELPWQFDQLFRNSLWYSILTKNTKLIDPNLQGMVVDLSKKDSVFYYNDLYVQQVSLMHIDDGNLRVPGFASEYFRKSFLELLTGNTHTLDDDIPDIPPDDPNAKVIYYGFVPENFVIDEMSIKSSLGRAYRTGREITIRSNNAYNSKLIYAYPEIFGDVIFIKDSNGFSYIRDFNKHKIVINDVMYNLYEAKNASTLDDTFYYRFDSDAANNNPVPIVDRYPCYYGFIHNDNMPTDRLIKTLHTVDKDIKDFKFYGENMLNGKALYAFPKLFGDLTTIKDDNGFSYMTSFKKEVIVIDGLDYNVYTAVKGSTVDESFCFRFDIPADMVPEDIVDAVDTYDSISEVEKIIYDYLLREVQLPTDMRVIDAELRPITEKNMRYIPIFIYILLKEFKKYYTN